MAKVQIKRMGVFSCAKIYSITLAAMGLIIGVIYGLIFMVVGGLELEIENMDTGTSYAPPAPNWGDQPPYTPGQQQQYPY